MVNYNEKIMDHVRNPKNAKEIHNPDGIGKAANPVYGDMIELRIKVDRNKITDASFKAFGCTAAVASCSIITEMIKDKMIGDVMKIDAKAIADALGGIPPERMHCSVLAEVALKNTLEDYLNKI